MYTAFITSKLASTVTVLSDYIVETCRGTTIIILTLQHKILLDLDTLYFVSNALYDITIITDERLHYEKARYDGSAISGEDTMLFFTMEV